MSAIASIEFDGKFTVTYRLTDGRQSGFRVVPEVGRLIAAAPELLAFAEREAAVVHVESCDSPTCHGPRCEALKDLIKKATVPA